MAHDILIVDDEADIRMLLAGVLEDEGHTTRGAANADEALEALRSRRPHLVILDIWLQNSRLDGLEILQQIQSDHAGVPVVMISGHGNIETAVKAIKIGAYDFIEKPFKADRLLLVVERAVEAARLKAENEELRLRAAPETQLFGSSSAVNHLKQAIAKVAPTGSRVLITGAAGSGKEVVARLIHLQSRRSNGPFMVLNCATLIRTGWSRNSLAWSRVGRRVASRKSEYSSAHTAARCCLMRWPTCLWKPRARSSACSGPELHACGWGAAGRGGCAGNRLHQPGPNGDDRGRTLSGRSVLSLECRADLRASPRAQGGYSRPLQPLHRTFRQKRRNALSRLGEDALAALQSYDWPGNVRQLRNVIDWLLIMAPGGPEDVIGAEALPPEITSQTPVLSNGAADLLALPLRQARERFEKQYLDAQVNRFGGNISRTAAFVGMERSALHRKLRLLGISTSER